MSRASPIEVVVRRAHRYGIANLELRISISVTNPFKGVAIANVDHHRKVLNAIEECNETRAYAAMEAILAEVMKLIETTRRRSKPAAARK